MNKFLVIALLLVSAKAQAFDCLVTDCSGWISKQQADQEFYDRVTLPQMRQNRQDNGQGLILQPLGELVGTIATLRFDKMCTLGAVTRRMSLPMPAKEKAPDVRVATRVLDTDFLTFYHNERGEWLRDNKVFTTTMPNQNIIFLDDNGSLYSDARSLDDSLAAQYALLFSQKNGMKAESAEAKALVADYEKWFHAAYTAKRRSPCSDPVE